MTMKRWIMVAAALAACGDNNNGDDDGAPDAAMSACLEADQLAALNEHAEALRFSAAMLAGHPGAREAVGFFDFVDLDVQRAAVFAGPLVMECSEPSSYDPYCEKDGLCSQIECTGQGTGWVMHFYLQAATGAYQTATVDTTWADGDDGVTVAIASDAGVWSVAGSGRMDADSVEVDETYAQLAPGGDVVLTIRDTSEGVHGGEITVGGEVAATVDVDGIYVASEACR
jgi:hypothetical protein